MVSWHMEKMATPDSGSSSSTSSASSSQQPNSSDSAIRLDSDQLSDQSSEPSSTVVSLLGRLKSPAEAQVARQRKTKTNPPPVDKRQLQGKSASDPKGIEPSKRVKEFPNEQLKVSGGKLFCSAC